jgi:hypothetical protein
MSSALSSIPWMRAMYRIDPSGPPSPLAPLSPTMYEERVVEDAHLLECRTQPADLRVGVRKETCIGFHVALRDAALRCGQGIPGGEGRRSRRCSSALAGMTPSAFCLAKDCSRNWSQPAAKRPL